MTSAIKIPKPSQDELMPGALTRVLLALSFSSDSNSTETSRLIKECFSGGGRERLVEYLSERLNADAWSKAGEEIELIQKYGIHLVSLLDSEYPSCLREISDPPLVLYVRGNIEAEYRIAIVGSRKATSYGRRTAKAFGCAIAESGGCVVSGLAYGIDAAAHEGVLAASMSESRASAGIAVLGSGLLALYPQENRHLAEMLIERGGAVISEYPLRMTPRRGTFPKRNRIISGLSEAVVVVEAAQRSGSLITARLALEQGRGVFAVPGPIDSALSRGANKLLAQGASIAGCVDDIFRELPDIDRGRRVRAESFAEVRREGRLESALELFSIDEKDEVLSIIKRVREERSCAFDFLAERSSLEPNLLSSLLARMELTGLVEVHSGQRYELGEVIEG